MELNAISDTLSKIDETYTPSNGLWQKIYSQTVAGSYTWVAPDLFYGNNYTIGVIVIGGGGSGAAVVSYSIGGAIGGGSGYSNIFTMEVNPGKSYNLVIGAGGASSTAQAVNVNGASNDGNPGGTSSFDGKTALGGGKGTSSSSASNDFQLGDGGQASDIIYVQDITYVPVGMYSETPYGGVSTYNALNQNGQLSYRKRSFPFMCVNPFEDNEPILAAGGSAWFNQNDYSQTETVTLQGGKSSAAIAYRLTSGNYNLTAIKGTLPGCGGGGCIILSLSTNGTKTSTSAAGCDGAVYIYAMKSLNQ